MYLFVILQNKDTTCVCFPQTVTRNNAPALSANRRSRPPGSYRLCNRLSLDCCPAPPAWLTQDGCVTVTSVFINDLHNLHHQSWIRPWCD